MRQSFVTPVHPPATILTISSRSPALSWRRGNSEGATASTHFGRDADTAPTHEPSRTAARLLECGGNPESLRGHRFGGGIHNIHAPTGSESAGAATLCRRSPKRDSRGSWCRCAISPLRKTFSEPSQKTIQNFVAYATKFCNAGSPARDDFDDFQPVARIKLAPGKFRRRDRLDSFWEGRRHGTYP